MTITDDITKALMEADTTVEATTDDEGPRRYALEAGIRTCGIPGVRAARVDSAELVGFIQRATAAHRHAEYSDIAELIVAEFNLDEEN